MSVKYTYTLFTPTYNRCITLKRLYNSLLSQHYKNFEWLIVDDGSTDETELLIRDFIEENKIEIVYIKQENGGKHRAINKGLEVAKGEYFFIVDSDDYLPSNSLEILNSYRINLSKNIIGIAGRRVDTQGNIIGDGFMEGNFISDHIEKSYIKNIKGDLAEVYQTEILRKFPFPDLKNEKFCAESLLWNRIAKKYKTLFIAEPIYVCEYLRGGLSDLSIINRVKSPNYAMIIYRELVTETRLPLKIKVRTFINYWRFSFYNKKGFIENWKNLNRNHLSLLLFPFGFLMKLKDDWDNFIRIIKNESFTNH
ncbi:MAG: glycosyl transferase [Aequorivita sp.]|nr:glycosyl transferase [Aequorivita sp.]MBF30640.1 glycosyl transferase [Aequorivita sp.]|tara:strand:- start:35495 stop:36421 length:927 start_codon:yes stop_codon:yes gene_type:complete